MIKACLIFLAYLACDILYVKFVQYVTRKEAVKAATCSATISLVITLGIMQCINNNWYLIPLLIGSWLGTYTAVNPISSTKT